MKLPRRGQSCERLCFVDGGMRNQQVLPRFAGCVFRGSLAPQ